MDGLYPFKLVHTAMFHATAEQQEALLKVEVYEDLLAGNQAAVFFEYKNKAWVLLDSIRPQWVAAADEVIALLGAHALY